MMRSCRWFHFSSAFLACFTVIFLILSCFPGCSASDTITNNGSLVDGETLVSAGKIFELGFFSPSGISNVKRYVGIWYVFDPQTVVWVANRRKPISDKTGVLHFRYGNLELSDKKGKQYWSTKIKITRFKLLEATLTLTLTDVGNLVLSDERFRANLWQSFKTPTDTFIFGMKLDDDLILTSWTSEEDPAPGNFTFQQDKDRKNQLLVLEKGTVYWRSSRRDSDKSFESEERPSTLGNLLNHSGDGDDNTQPHIKERMVMNFTGDLQYWQFDTGMNKWSLIWWEPKDKCSKYNYCGNFGTCNNNNNLACKCLPGFKPEISDKWNDGDYSDGCSRNSTSCGHHFVKLKRMKVGSASPFGSTDEKSCSEACRSDCRCQAYSFIIRDDSSVSCSKFSGGIEDIREDQDDGYDLYVRVALSDIEPISRSCGTCGTNLVPYPLSIRPNCGDPMYYDFYCNDTTGQLRVKTPSGNYTVISVDPEVHIFIIEVQAKDGVSCDAMHSSGSKILQLNNSSQFDVTSNCSGVVGKFTNDSMNGTIEVKISWKPPLEPTCKSSADCKDWPQSTCSEDGNGRKRCLCNKTFQWDGFALNCFPVAKQSGESINKSKSWPLFLKLFLPIAMALLCTIVSLYLWRKKVAKKREKQKKHHLHRYDTERGVKELMESNQLEGKDGTGIDVPFFDFASILAATDNFSDENKLGKGGFGPVYKGKFPGGREIAIKRLASVSGQGMEEFKNEVVLIAKLQHRNLVRLLGYCIRGDEKILLYEYMPNKSLDSFIFDESFSQQLDWETRFNIILGTARGLLYLHQDSRLRIIHRDMKTSNILLDEEMNPKISDFGLARMIQGKQTEGSTARVVGTYGYMAPEYALDGLFSIKSDVFSFGVVMLEIISGKKNMRFYHVENTPSLIAYAWRLWQEGNALDLMEETMRSSCKESEVLRSVQVGLLCVQEDPGERPTMSDVVVMLGSETTSLPTPNQPAFLTRTIVLSATASTSGKAETNNEISASLEEGR